MRHSGQALLNCRVCCPARRTPPNPFRIMRASWRRTTTATVASTQPSAATYFASGAKSANFSTSLQKTPSVSSPLTQPLGRTMSKKVISAAMIGHTVESYDFIIYGYAATAIATVFFPSENRITALLSAFAVYGVAFAVRPLGAAIFGSMGDRIGRKNTLSTIVLLMAIGTAAIGFIPTYSSIGIAAPIILVCCRLVQGISMGAEYTSAASYVMEHAPLSRRGLWMSAVTSASFIGSALAVMVLLGLQLVSKTAYLEWSWRVPFLLGGVMALVGLYMRLRLEESPEFTKLGNTGRVARTPIRDTFRNWRVFLLLFTVFTLLALVAQNFLGYLPTYLTETTGLSSITVLVSSSIALLLCAALVVGSGVVSGGSRDNSCLYDHRNRQSCQHYRCPVPLGNPTGAGQCLEYDRRGRDGQIANSFHQHGALLQPRLRDIWWDRSFRRCPTDRVRGETRPSVLHHGPRGDRTCHRIRSSTRNTRENRGSLH
ncbi:MAG: MFS transporter [Hyphomicrobiales bacterium]|nr:MAG: MFS transporter [Hyphomicrobiales bacterium]